MSTENTELEQDNIITAPEGYVFTNGRVYGKVIRLAVGVSKDDFYEITEEEYNQLKSEEEGEQATTESLIKLDQKGADEMK
jgi:hypothetical protein